MLIRGTIIRQSRLISKPSLLIKRTTPQRTFVTNQIADLLTSTHELSGIPWVVLVPLTTFTLRTMFTLPISIWQRKRIVKQQELRKISQSSSPIIKSRLALMVNQKGTKTKLTPDQIHLLAMKESRKRQKALFKFYNVPMWKNVILPLVQIPLWTTLSLSIRNLTSLEIERSTKQWFESFNWNGMDLTGPLVDYPVIIPLTLGALSLMNVEYNGKMISRRSTDNVGIMVYKDDQSRMNQAMNSILNISRIGCIFMMGVSSQSAILLSLYWISSQLYSLVQNIILDKMWPYQR